MIRAAALLVWLASAATAEPLLSIDITLAPDEDYATAVSVITGAGAEVTSLSLLWDEMETEPGVFAPADDWPAIANRYFPTIGLSFTLTFSVIDTVADRRPPDLRGKPWDDPLVIGRFAAHVDAVLSRMDKVPLIAIAVGNEVDALLSGPDEIAAYARFLTAARTEIARLRPGLPVSAKLTFSGVSVNPDAWQPILAAGDAAFFTYYPFAEDFLLRPPGDVPADLDRMRAIARGKPLWLLEAGYPSEGCGAPQDGQSLFVAALLDAAEASADVRLVSLTFLTDLPAATVDSLVGYYGVAQPCFRRYLASLGLRDAAGREKPALEALRARHGAP